MKETLKNQCECFLRNRDVIKRGFKMDNSYMIAICANTFASKHREADDELLTRCRQIVEKNTSVFSTFRGNTKLPVISMLAVSDEPEAKFEKARKMYEMLKKEFRGSEYLVVAAFVLSDMVSVEEAERYISRGGNIYRLMSKEHPFLTSAEDSVFAILLAFSEKSDEQLISDMENCYTEMKKKFSDGNSVQSLSHVLALTEGSCAEKCAKVVRLYDALSGRGRKYGKYYEIAILGAAAVLPIDTEEFVNDVIDADAFLAEQKGYAGMFGIDKKTRLMHAVMLTINDCSNVAEIAAVTGTLSMIASQQAAMCCAVTATCITASTTSHS